MKLKKTPIKILVTILFVALCPAIKADIYKENRIPNGIKTKIEKIVNEPSRLAGIDGFERKNKTERIMDNIEWYKRYGYVNEFYSCYCLDVKNFRTPDNYLIDETFNRYPKHHNITNPRKYAKRIFNKTEFANTIRKLYPQYLPKIYFKFKGNEVSDENSKKKSTIAKIKSLPDNKYFIKPVSGECGNDAILLTKKNKKLQFQHVTKGKISESEFIKITKHRSFLLQEYVENHEDIKKLSPYTLNTVRIVTTRFNDDVHIFGTDLRFGFDKNTIVDNFAKGGAIVHVDEDTGTLGRYAFRRHDKVMLKHPISKIKFEGYQLPYWHEALEMVKKLHKLFFQIPSIGWDVAITPTGPKIIEGNCGWDIFIPQTTVGGLKEKWEKLQKM